MTFAIYYFTKYVAVLDMRVRGFKFETSYEYTANFLTIHTNVSKK